MGVPAYIRAYGVFMYFLFFVYFKTIIFLSPFTINAKVKVFAVSLILFFWRKR